MNSIKDNLVPYVNIHSVDYARFFFAICVLLIHTDFLGGNNNYLGYVFCQGLLRISVPFFFVTSGYFFHKTLNKNREGIWLWRNFKIYTVWMIVYFPLVTGMYRWVKGEGSLYLDFEFISFTILFGYWHLWFFPALLIAALLTTFTSLFKIKPWIVTVLCTALYLIGVYLQYRGNYANNVSRDSWSLANVAISRNGLFMGFPLFIAGYYINQFSINYKSLNLVLVSVLLVVTESSVNYYLGAPTFDILLTIPLPAIAIFLYLIQSGFVSKFRLDYSEHSKNIYLIQVYIILAVKELCHTWIGVTGLSLMLSCIYSLLLVFIKNNLKQRSKMNQQRAI